MKKQVFKAAWAYFKKGIYTTFAESLKAAWKAAKIKGRMIQGVTKFTYRKANGEVRKAFGTLAAHLLPPREQSKSTKSNPDVIKYFDLEKKAWRCFRIERLL